MHGCLFCTRCSLPSLDIHHMRQAPHAASVGLPCTLADFAMAAAQRVVCVCVCVCVYVCVYVCVCVCVSLSVVAAQSADCGRARPRHCLPCAHRTWPPAGGTAHGCTLLARVCTASAGNTGVPLFCCAHAHCGRRIGVATTTARERALHLLQQPWLPRCGPCFRSPLRVHACTHVSLHLCMSSKASCAGDCA
jgi:hypothetical protein